MLNQGLKAGFPRALVAVCAVGICDTLLITLGAVGASGLIAAAPGLREILIVIGAAFLTFLGLRALLSSAESVESPEIMTRPAAVVAQAAGVSLLNPHAILDTVSVIGGAIAAQAPGERVTFALGTMSASWIWFMFLIGFGSILKNRLTPSARLWIQRTSGIIMLVFAVILATKLL